MLKFVFMPLICTLDLYFIFIILIPRFIRSCRDLRAQYSAVQLQRMQTSKLVKQLNRTRGWEDK